MKQPNLRKSVLICLAVASLSLTACSSDSDGFTLDISNKQLQTKLAERFPREDCSAVIFCVAAHSPQVILVEGSQRIGLRMSLGTRSPALGKSAPDSGSATLSAKLRYDKSQAALYLDDVRIDDLQVAALPQLVVDTIKKLGPQLIGNSLQSQPIYQVKADTVSEKQQRMVIGDVRVKDGKIKVLVKLPNA